MTATFILVTALVILAAAITTLVARRLFDSFSRRDPGPDEGETPSLFHVADPYITGLIESQYRSLKHNPKETRHV